MAQHVSVTRSQFASRILYLDGKPFSLAGVPFMAPILDCPYERMVEMTGRQVGKSTNNSALMLTSTAANEHHRVLYIAPRNEQVIQFSKDRLSHMINYSPFFQDWLINSKVQQQVRAKEFTNGSFIFLRSCYHTADGARGITANDIYFDEVQDILLENIPIIEECSARKVNRKIVYSGTPKTFDNPIAQIWDQSTQNYWAVKCPACNHWNIPLDIANLGEESLVCAKCGKPISALTGMYVSKFPEKGVAGFHISQLMIYGNPGTGLPWSRVMEKYRDPLYGIAKFTNECLGFPYDVGAKLLTEGHLRACSTREGDEYYQPQWTIDRDGKWGLRLVFAGVDWGVLGGNTRTVLTIGGLTPAGKLKVYFAKKFPVDQDPVEQVTEVGDLIAQAGCRMIAADRGGGHVANAFLRKKLPNTLVYEIEYKPRVTQGMYYNTKSMSWITDRTRALSGVIIDIKSRMMEFPDYRCWGSTFAPDLLTLSCDYNDNLRAYQILRQNSIPDDFAHALTYLRLAARKMAVNPHAKAHSLDDFVLPGSDEWVDNILSDSVVR